MRLAPIGIITYSRLFHLKQTIDALQKNTLALKSELYIFSDAAKPGDENNVIKTREYCRTIKGFKSVNIVERKTNGRVKNRRAASNLLLDKYGRMIFLQDDNVTAPGFLEFMNAALNFYENNKNIIAISGFNVPVQYPQSYRYDYYLSFFFNAWGYATWDDRGFLEAIDYNNAYNEMINNRSLYEKVNTIHPKLIHGLKQIQDGKLNAGDYNLVFHSIKNNLYTIKPIHSFVNNIGYDGSGVHCGISNKFGETFSLNKKKVTFFDRVNYEFEIDKIFYNYFHPETAREAPKNLPVAYPKTLNFMANDVCNSRCKMCLVWNQKRGKEITPDEFSTILSDPLFHNLQYVGVSGGEPTLREDLPELFHKIACIENIKGTGLITNAMDAEQVIHQIAKCNQVCLGANLPFNVMVSLDGIGKIHDQVRGRKGAFKNALKVIRHIRDNTNITLAIGCTVIKDNVWHLDEVLDFCKKEKVYGRFRIGEFINRLYNKNQKKSIRNFDNDERYQIALFFSKLELTYEKSLHIKATYRNIRQMIFEGESRASGCPYRSEALGLDSRGNLLFCSPKSPDLGSCLEKSAALICEENKPIRESIINKYCSNCIHDYHEAPSKDFIEEYLQEEHLRKFMSVGQSTMNSIRLPAALPASFEWSKFKKALIVGWYGTETIGDKAIISDIIRRLKDANPKIQIKIASLYPFITRRSIDEIRAENVGIIKTYSPDYIEACKYTDVVIMGGGPLMGMEPLGFVLTAFSEARKANIPCVIEGCGIGPLIEDAHILAVKEILRLSTQIRVRDKTSLSWVFENTGRGDAICTGDPAARFVVEWKKENLKTKEINDKKYFACLLREITIEYANGQSLTDFMVFREQFENELGMLIRHIREKTGLKPLLMPMHTFAVGQDDRDFARRFAERYLQDGDYDIGNKIYSPQDILSVMSKSRFNVCMRFHSVLFAEKLDVPFMAIDYTGGGKINGFLKDQNKLEFMFDRTDISNKNWRQKIDKILLGHDLRSLKVVHLCHQDYGGAGKAAYRLNKGLQQIGVDSTMLVLNKKSGDPSVKVVPSDFLGKLQKSLDFSTYLSPLWSQQLLHWQTELAKYSNRPAGLEMFTDALSDVQLEQIKEIQDADIINLHWVAGALDYSSIPLSLRDKRIVWTSHDMNPFTGGCHYSGDCEKYKENCGSCPQLGSTIKEDLSSQTWNLKNYAFQNLNLNIVTPSKWLAKCVSQSSLLSECPVRVIPNGFPLDIFKPFKKTETRRSLNIPENVKVILFGADSIVNARKGFAYLLEALKRLPSNKEYTVVVLTFGAFPEGLPIDNKHKVYNLGVIADENKLALAYSVADVFVIPSLEDNLPNTVVEAMACGVPVVGFDIGGIPDMIEHKKNGFLAKPKDIDSLLEGIDWVLSLPDGGKNISALCRERAETKFALEVQANAYKELYDAIISDESLKSEDVSTKQGISEHNSRRNSKAPDLLYEQAHKLIDEGKIEAAIGTFEKPISDNSRFDLAHNDLGVLYGNQGQNEKVLRYHEKTIQLQPKNIKFRRSLAEFYDNIGKLGQALGIYINLLKENPEDLEVLLALGRITLDLKKYDEALIFYQKALAVSPANTRVRNAFLKLGEKIKLSGDPNKARELYLYYLSHNPKDDRIGHAWEELKDAEKDKKIIKKIKAKKDDYLVSAIVSTYNSEEFIEECLKNLESQTIGDRLEIVVVNAASPQNEEKIVKEFQKHYSNISYIQTRGRVGIYTAWNIAIKEAAGRYCISASTNDILNPEACEILVRYLDQNPECMLVYGDTYLTRTPHESFEKNTHTETYRWPPHSFQNHLNNCLVGPHPMWRKKVHADIGFFDERYIADGDQEFWLRIGEKHHIAHIPFFTGLQWVSDDAISRKGRLPHLEVMHIRSLYKKRFAERVAKKNDLCSIIIPVFNQVEYTKQCIEALYKNTPKGLFELIIVDNNSTDGTKNFLAHLEEDVKIISNPENLGFAKACNQGASEASGAFLLFLNNDTVPLPDWLEEMADSANSDVKVGIVGSKLLYPDGTIQHAGIGFINGIPDHPFRNLPGDHPEANIPKELDMVTGACLLIKKDLFFECGGFDEQYTNGVEDIDLCLKVRLTGHKVVYNPKSTLYHYEGKTPGRFDHVKENLEIFFSRWKNHFDDHGRMIYKTESQKIRIKWEGSQFVNHSLALVNRELCIQLANREDMELCIIPYELDEFGAEEDPARLGMIADRLNSPLSAAADFHIRHQWPPNFTPPPEGHWIIIQPWEFGALPKNWVVPMETLVDELWVPSNHVRDVYIQSGISPDKVFVVPNGVNYGQFHPQITKFPLDTNKKFKFLFVGGTIMRKGIDVLLSAYAELFSSEDDVCLVIKDMGGESFYKGQNASWMIADIKKDPTAPEILYITETLKNEEIAGLYTACDCLVHPYRGEGFGLPVAEAMACGLPVIVTKGGACDDFCSEKNAYLVSSTKRPIHLSSYELNGPGWLLEPDKSQLIEMLKFVYEHPDKARERGAIAAREIKRKVDWKMSKDLIVDRLRALKDKPIRRFAGSAHEHSGKDLKSPEEIYQNIQQSMENRQPQEVIAELEKLAESHPQFALAHNDLGVLHYTAGNKEKAHQYYENAVQLDPESLVFQKNLADYYYVELGRVEDALRIYVKILEANPEDTETLLITGHICVSQHRFDDARVFYRRVLALEPLNEDARNNLEKLDRMDSKAGEAETAQEIYQEMFPLLGNGDPHKAIKSLTELLERFPDFALAHNDLGVLYYRAGDKQRAQHHYERAVELTPDNINFQKNLADFYCIELGRIEDALKLYVSILAADPQDIETLMATAQICKALEKLDDAKDFFNQVLQIEPWNADARKQINEIEEPASGACLNLKSAEDVYRRLKERLNTLTPAEAIVEFEKLIDSYPDFAIGHNDLGVLYYNTDNKEKALRHYKQAAELQPENMTLQKNLADFLFVELGRVEDALQIYVGILATHPDDVETLLITGHICVALKRFDEAQDFYERVLALEPGNEDASQNLHAISNRRNERSTSQPDAFTAMSVSSAKVEAMDLNSKASENTDTEGKTSASIVVSLNGIQNRVKECLKSIQVHTAAPYQLLLIDRDTGKGIQKWAQQLAEANDDYHLIACTRQAGWAECINQAVEKADGELIVLMHNDVVLPEGWLNTFLMGIHFEPNTGVVGPMCNRVAGIQQIIQTDESDRTDFEATAAAFYEQNRHRRVSVTKLSDICLVFRRELVEKIGSFDKQYASAEICVEDFCNRAAAAGYKNWVAADTYVYHYDRHKAQKKFAANNSASTEDRKIYKEKWNGAPTPEARAFQTVQLLAKAEEFSQKGQIDQAVETLLVGIGTHAEDKRPYYALAEILLAAKRFQDAKEALNEIPSTNGDAEPQKLELLGYAEEGLANHKASQACVEQLLAINPRHAPALNLKGNLAYHDADPSSAEKYFKRAIDADPGYAKPFTNMGILQMEAGRHADALNSIEMGFRLCPTDLDIATHYHSLVTEIAGFENAEPVAREAAALYPNNQKVKYMLIDFMIQQGKYELAMPEIEDAIIRFGLEDGILGAALKIREKLGPMTVDKSAKKVPVSLCMIIKDEEKYLARCLASVKPIVDEMIVVDTGSNDRSKDIAVTFGARVYTYDWQNDFAAARNFSISKASGDWILILDGDEVISPLDHEQFNKMVAKKPKAPVAYSITTRNYNPLANIVGWVSNDGNYPAEEATIGWLPSEKVRLFYGKDQIWFEGAVHEMVDPVLKRNTIEIKKCNIPVHHYGRLDKKKLDRKGEIYFEIGQKKLAEMGEDPNALRELAIQATILERNQEGLDLWKRLLALNPFPELTAVAYVNMGTIYSRLERFEDALDVSKKAMAVDPDLKEAQYNCALAELHCGHSAAAIETLEKLLRSFPDYPPAQFILCAAYCCADQKDRGLEGIQNQKKTPMGVHLAMPFFELGQSLIAAKQIPYALAVLGAAIESDIVSKQILELFNKCIQMRETTQNSQERHPVVEAGSASGQF